MDIETIVEVRRQIRFKMMEVMVNKGIHQQHQLRSHVVYKYLLVYVGKYENFVQFIIFSIK